MADKKKAKKIFVKKQNDKLATRAAQDIEDLPSNAVKLQSTPAHRAKIQRRKLAKRLRRLAVLVLAVLIVVVFVSGQYRYIALGAANFADSTVIALKGGDGFPVSYSLRGYKTAQEMSSAFAVLSEQELLILSSKGKELSRLQHEFVRPGLTSGDYRLCLYSRSGKDYYISDRNGNLTKKVTENNILFAEMSKNGGLAIFSTDTTQAKVEIFSPVDYNEPSLVWNPSGMIPVAVEYHSDNKTLAVGCAFSSGGTLNTNIYLLKIGRNISGTAKPLITANNMLPLQIHFLSGTRILVIYDADYAAVYDANGEELYRYNYENQQIVSANVLGGNVLLTFGGDENISMFLLDNKLQLQASQIAPGSENTDTLLTSENVFLMAGQQVFVYSLDFELQETKLYESKTSGMVFSEKALILTTNKIEEIFAVEKPAESSVFSESEVLPSQAEDMSTVSAALPA